MKKNNINGGLLALFLAMMTLSGFSWAQTSLWQVTDGEKTLYIGGTIHLLREQDYPLPVEFQDAYKRSEILVLEADLKAADSPEFTKLLMDSMMLPKGESLSQKLKPKTLAALSAFLSKNSQSIESWEAFEPAFASLVMAILEYGNLGFGGELGVDKYFSNLAEKDGRKQLYLETLEQQLKFLTSFKDIDPDELIMSTLKELQDISSVMKKALVAWQQGDMPTLFKEMGEPMLVDAPSVYESLLVTRNQNWIPKLQTMLKTPEKELVLVGSLHLAGPDSVLKLLEKAGYKVTPYQGAKYPIKPFAKK